MPWISQRRFVPRLSREPGLYCGSFDLPVNKSAASRHFRVLLPLVLAEARVAG